MKQREVGLEDLCLQPVNKYGWLQSCIRLRDHRGRCKPIPDGATQEQVNAITFAE